MNTCYVIAPLLGLIAFAGVHRHYARAYESRVEEEKRIALHAKQETERLRNEAQAKALTVATTAADQRKRDTAENARRDESLRQAKLDAEARHTAALERLGHVRQHHAQLREEIEGAATELASREKALLGLRLQRDRVTQQIALADENRSAVERFQNELEAVTPRRPATLASAPRKRP